jgi:hypothetical protein
LTLAGLMHRRRGVRLVDDVVGRGQRRLGRFSGALAHPRLQVLPVLRRDDGAGVAPRLVVDGRGARGERVLGRENRRQLVVHHLDQARCRLGCAPRLGHHGDHPLAGEADLVAGQDGHIAHHPAVGRLGYVLRREHPGHAVGRRSLRGVNAGDPRVRNQAPNERRVQHPRQAHVAHVAGRARSFGPRVIPVPENRLHQQSPQGAIVPAPFGLRPVVELGSLPRLLADQQPWQNAHKYSAASRRQRHRCHNDVAPRLLPALIRAPRCAGPYGAASWTWVISLGVR